MAIKLRGIAEMAKKSATATNAPMVAPRIHKGKAFVENDDIVSAYGGGAKWQRFAKFRRAEQIQQGYSLPRWLRDFQTHSKQNKQAKFL